MKLTGLFRVFSVVVVVWFAATRADGNHHCNPPEFVRECKNKPCTFLQTRGTLNGRKASKL